MGRQCKELVLGWGIQQRCSNGLYQDFYNMGRMINQGFVNGINDFSHLARNAMQKWGSQLVTEAKAELDIHSPSREAYSIAEYLSRDLIMACLT